MWSSIYFSTCYLLTISVCMYLCGASFIFNCLTCSTGISAPQVLQYFYSLLCYSRMFSSCCFTVHKPADYVAARSSVNCSLFAAGSLLYSVFQQYFNYTMRIFTIEIISHTHLGKLFSLKILVRVYIFLKRKEEI